MELGLFEVGEMDASQRWQPAPGSKAAMLVKVNSMSRSQPLPALPPPQQPQHLQLSKANTFTLHPSGSKPQGGGHVNATQGYKTAPSGKMTPDARQAHHLRKASNGSFCLVSSDGGQPSPLLHRSQTSTPRPGSPPYGRTTPIYDEPVSACPIYDEPPTDMEIEGAHLHNGPPPPPSRLTPTHSLQKPRHLQQPGSSHSGSRHRRNPSASDYSPAGLECIKHMINVDPKQGPLPGSPVPPRSPSPASRPDPAPTPPPPQAQAHSLPQARGPTRDREPGTPGPSTLDKKQSWRVLEATVQRAMEARHSRQSSQASQDFPSSSTPLATANYQDSGYSTGPSPSLRRKSRRRMGAGGGGAGGRPGSVGSSGELCALNERLMAEMREVVSRSNTMREVRAGLDPEMGEAAVAPRTRSPADSLRWYGGGGSASRCASREELAATPRSLGRAGHPALTPLEIPGRQKRTYEKVDTLELSDDNARRGVTCHPVTAGHLPRAAGTRYPCQAPEIQDTASLGQEGGPLRPIWPGLGEEAAARWYQGVSVPRWLERVRTQPKGALSRPPKSILECSSDLLPNNSALLPFCERA
ncbi:hypothetical protein EYF80_038390 [Liparis tanakae]|uniref:Uncharacterized protein n=1 Tax=Liparis tanakae TaxID=230148 RepID=A0A4Z2GCX8_9TELE|nr:hypothetical protein EYF80_038390 [Liparis tanakae]